jgi:hypothetical protein
VNKDIIKREFEQVFRAKKESANRLERGQVTGRVDTSRVGRVATGTTNVFARRTFDGDSEVAGALAICCALQDLHSYHLYGYDESDYTRDAQLQANTWKDTVQAMFEAAKELGIEVRIFAANVQKPSYREIDLREYDVFDDFIEDSGVNSWTRHKECIGRASGWLKNEVKTEGKKLILQVSMWPEMRDAETNRRESKYREFV